MKNLSSVSTLIFCIVIIFSVSAMAGPPDNESAEMVITDYTLLVGYPDSAKVEEGTVLIVPGTVLTSVLDSSRGILNGSLEKQLGEAYRLEKIVNKTQYLKRMAVGQEYEMPEGVSDISVRLTLLGHNELVATYRVVVEEGAKLLADTPVSVEKGGKAVVGSRNGEQAPYLFIVIAAGGEKAEKTSHEKKLPKLIERINPEYPEECRKEKIAGVVVMEILVAGDGSTKVVKVVESPHELLSQAAVEAANQWRFEPAMDEDGNPEAVQFSITVKFALK